MVRKQEALNHATYHKLQNSWKAEKAQVYELQPQNDATAPNAFWGERRLNSKYEYGSHNSEGGKRWEMHSSVEEKMLRPDSDAPH